MVSYNQTYEFGAGGTSFQDYIETPLTPHEIHQVFGRGLIWDGDNSGDGKVCWEWSFVDGSGSYFNVYDYKADTQLHEKQRWHVGALRNSDYEAFIAWFTECINLLRL